MLLLAEELFLLSIDPKTKRVYGRASSAMPYSFSDALIAELMIGGQVELHRSKLEVVHSEVEDPLLKETLEIMLLKKKKTPKYWVSALKRSHKNIARKIANKLEQVGVGNIEEKRILGMFPSYTYTFNQTDFIKTMKESFQTVLEKSNKQESLDKEEERVVVLMSLVHVSNLLRIVFPDRKEVKRTEKQIKQLSKNLPVSKAVKVTIDSINTAIFTASSSASRS
ncbi:GPP34 family phosphoprotein [Oceanobacillus jeddahense]|uniref:GPP34 family phosphoprotein n=1 Tax=Oceanobacillus jeddahense TaxID=1462527 RepID=A0ABY5JXZ2_9BACI|nr:GPP34 family phosphoprotein [Oceanobacillus jeddahense]UUI03926.1 GPP34 family phosphoprotein [Oceanobacillus jeddahense]